MWNWCNMVIAGGEFQMRTTAPDTNASAIIIRVILIWNAGYGGKNKDCFPV